MRLLAHRLWHSLKPYVVVEECKDGRARLELKPLPKDLRTEALRIKCPCVSCGASIHPIRNRRSKNQRSKTASAHLYIGVACPLSQRIGCSRGKAASLEYTRIRAAVGGAP